MSIDLNTLRGLATILCLLAFAAVVLWAYSGDKRKDFDDAAQLPFADDRVNRANNKKIYKKGDGEARHV